MPAEHRNYCCDFEEVWEDSREQHRLEGERARRVRRGFKDKGGTTMSDDTLRPARPAQHDETGDEVEAHGHHKLGANAEAGDETESDNEVEAHAHHKLGHPKKA